MTTPRHHIHVAADTHREAGVQRGQALESTLAGAYEKYAELFGILGVGEEQERRGAETVLSTLREWRPAILEELEGIAAGSGLELHQVVALNARTEILALSGRASHECSTLTAQFDGTRHGVQTWDWHIELDPFWHTQIIDGPGLTFAGLTEQGIVSKIGVNEAGLALHFNILGHTGDSPAGVPMHVLSAVVLSECATVEAALELIRSTPIASSSAFTMIDATTAVSVEMSPAGVFVIEEADGSVQRTNHFQHPTPLAGQKSELYEPETSQRLALVRERLAAARPESTADMVSLLCTGPGEPPLTCVPDMSLNYGDRWATLATVVTDPGAPRISILSGRPTDAEAGDWTVLDLSEKAVSV